MPIVTLPGGELRDEIRQIAYDSQFIYPAEPLAADRPFFATLEMLAIDDLSPVMKSTLFTNMKQAGSFGSATSFRCQGFSFEAMNSSIVGGNEFILPVVMNKSSITMTVGEKIYWQGPARFACGRYMQNVSTTTAATTFVNQQYGWPAIAPLIFSGKHVIDVNPLQPMRVNWQILPEDLTAAEAALFPADTAIFQLALKGALRRPVQ